MKNTGIVLVGVASGVVAAVVTYAVLANFQSNATPKSDEDFIAEVREGASSSGDPGVQTASLSPANATDSIVPSIEMETDHYKMGTIASDRITQGEVIVYNRGKAPLQITKVNTQCGCTKGKMLKNIIPPGESGILQVTLDPFRVAGFSSTKTLTLFTNDPKNPTVRLQVSADVTPEIRFVPEKIEFGVVAKGEAQTATIRAIQNVDEAFTINSLKLIGSRDHYSYEYAEVPPGDWENPDRREYILTAKVLPSAPPGKLRANLVVETSYKRLPRTTIPISLEVRGLYALNPQIVTLRSVQAGETVADIMKLDAEVPIEITQIDSSNEYLTVTHRKGNTPNSIAFDVAIAEDPPQRWQRDTWTLHLKAGDKEFIEEVRVMAIIENVSDAPASPATAVQTKPILSEDAIKLMREKALKEAQERAAEAAAKSSTPELAPKP